MCPWLITFSHKCYSKNDTIHRRQVTTFGQVLGRTFQLYIHHYYCFSQVVREGLTRAIHPHVAKCLVPIKHVFLVWIAGWWVWRVWARHACTTPRQKQRLVGQNVGAHGKKSVSNGRRTFQLVGNRNFFISTCSASSRHDSSTGNESTVIGKCKRAGFEKPMWQTRISKLIPTNIPEY